MHLKLLSNTFEAKLRSKKIKQLDIGYKSKWNCPPRDENDATNLVSFEAEKSNKASINNKNK